MQEEKQQKQKEQKEWLSTMIQILVVILIVVLLRTFVIGTIYVKGSSMEPNFHHGDFLVINKLEVSLSTPRTGDVVICRLDNDGNKENIIKRVIGTPGDEIDIRLDDYGVYQLYVNQVLIKEPYIAGPMTEKGNISYPFVVPQGHYFVMGDNRNASTDSRRTSIGAIADKDVIGHVILRLYPFDSIAVVE